MSARAKLAKPRRRSPLGKKRAAGAGADGWGAGRGGAREYCIGRDYVYATKFNIGATRDGYYICLYLRASIGKRWNVDFFFGV